MTSFFLLLYLVSLFATVFVALASPNLHPIVRSSRCPVRLNHDPPARSSPQTSTSRFSPVSQHDLTPRIVNGDILSRNLVPYMVTTLTAGLCTGTLISPNWFITAAHCNIEPNTLIQISEPIRDPDSRASFRTVIESRPHPNYVNLNQGGEFDFALIRFSPPATAPDSKFMSVNINTSIPEPQTFTRVMGYGVLEYKGDTDNVARQVDVPVTTSSECENIYKIIDSRYQLCAGYVQSGGCDACQGDSGGPLIQYDAQGEPVLVGVVSFGNECAKRGFPGVYTRTAAFIDFMDLVGVPYTRESSVIAVFQEPSGLSTAAIAGIAVAAVVAAVVFLVISVWFVKRHRSLKKPGEHVPDAQVYPVAPDSPQSPSLGVRPGQVPYVQSPQASYIPTPPTPSSQPAPTTPTVPQQAVNDGIPVYSATLPTFTQPTQPMYQQYTPPTYATTGQNVTHGIFPPPPPPPPPAPGAQQ